MGIDVWEVIEAAKTKPFGFQAFYPGPGLGGHCIPIDPFYLTWKAREIGHELPRFIELAGEINTAMPTIVVQRVAEPRIDRHRALKGSPSPGPGAGFISPDVDDPAGSAHLRSSWTCSERARRHRLLTTIPTSLVRRDASSPPSRPDLDAAKSIPWTQKAS